jgi:hypothetical protein
MEIILPVTVTDSILTSSTVPENDHAAWASGTTYSIGDKVILVSTHKIYESLVNSNTGNNPATDDGTNWLEISATNRWKAFDQKISEKVSQANSIEYVFDPTGELITSIAFFGLDAVSLTVEVEDSTDGVVFNETYSLIDNTYVIDWFTYFFEPNRYLEERVITNIPPYVGPTITATITETGGTAEVGQIVFGRSVDLGVSQYGTSVSIEDYSRKERDTFGNPIIVQRAFSQRAEFDFTLPTGSARRVQSILSGVRTTPVVWSLGSDTSQYGTTIYGFYRDFSITLSTPSISYGTVEVEGLT